jgi:hypothetical protein
MAVQWLEANEPETDNRFRGGGNFSRVAQKREDRAANPDRTTVEADSILQVIDSLIEGEPQPQKIGLAATLGRLAFRLPHGNRDKSIRHLIALAPRQSRAACLQSLVLSGETIAIGDVRGGIAEVFKAAEKQRWILTDGDAYQLRDWLRLLPFTDDPKSTVSIIQGMPAAQREPQLLEEMIYTFGTLPTPATEDVLFDLAEADNRLYQSHAWRETISRLRSPSAARRYIDLVLRGQLKTRDRQDWDTSRELSRMIAEIPEAQSYAYQVLRNADHSPELETLARAISENVDAVGLQLLVDLEQKWRRSVISRQTIEAATTRRVPVEGWQGAYDIVPIAAVDLRKSLLARANGNADSSAARILMRIDTTRDQYGSPESELRHPDLSSGLEWPILRANAANEEAD